MEEYHIMHSEQLCAIVKDISYVLTCTMCSSFKKEYIYIFLEPLSISAYFFCHDKTKPQKKKQYVVHAMPFLQYIFLNEEHMVHVST